MPRKSRERQLAKLAARRQAERRRQQRKRAIVMGVIAAVVVAGGLFAFAAITGGEPEPRATSTPSPTPSRPPKGQKQAVTPTAGPAEVACGAEAPKYAMNPKPQWKKPPRMTVNTEAKYPATIETSCGTIVLELFADKAPETVNSFIFLAQQHFFDGMRFHRIANSIDVIQAGDPTGTGGGGPGYTIPDEYDNGPKFEVGSIAMANTGQPDSGGSQFFIITGPRGLDLPSQYTVFGRVVKGLRVAKVIQQVPVGGPGGDTPQQSVYIEHLTITGELGPEK